MPIPFNERIKIEYNHLEIRTQDSLCFLRELGFFYGQFFDQDLIQYAPWYKRKTLNKRERLESLDEELLRDV